MYNRGALGGLMQRFAIGLLGIALAACGPPTPAGGSSSSRTRCETNEDCRSDFICSNARCVRGARPVVDAGPAPTDAGAMADASINPVTDAGDQMCGNGMRDEGEDCDDGNTSNSDACLNTCVMAQCGDGFVREGVEQCDDGNTMNGDGCSSLCAVEDQGPLCGNGRVEDGEECDDGNRVAGDGCDERCQTEEQGTPDHGDTPEEAMRITVPARVSAALESPTDRDFFRFFATQTGVYMIETTGQTDTVCAVLFSGNPLASDDDSGVSNNCAIQRRLDAGRTYHIRVSGSGGATGAYELQVNR